MSPEQQSRPPFDLERQTVLLTILGFFGVPEVGPLMESYQENEYQRKVIAGAWKKMFDLDISKPHIGLQEVRGTVALLEEYLLRKPHGEELTSAAQREIAVIITRVIQEKYLANPEAQFGLIKDLRDALIQGGGSEKGKFDFEGAGKTVLDVLLKSFELKEKAEKEQQSETIALFQGGMVYSFQQIVTLDL